MSTVCDQPAASKFSISSAKKATAEWLKSHGEDAMFTLGTVFMWSAAAHAAYLAAVPQPLRVSIAKRNQRLWKGLALGSLVGVALYDSIHSTVLADQQHQLTAEAKRLRAELQDLSA